MKNMQYLRNQSTDLHETKCLAIGEMHTIILHHFWHNLDNFEKKMGTQSIMSVELLPEPLHAMKVYTKQIQHFLTSSFWDIEVKRFP